MHYSTHIRSCAALLAIASLASFGLAAKHTHQNDTNHGTAAAYPWVFENGTDTSRMTAITTAEEIGRRAGYATVGDDDASKAWNTNNSDAASPIDAMPTRAELRAFGQSVHASKILYGVVNWNTRSIWVNLGPKTISTAKVDVYVYDVASNKVVYSRKGIEGRSDEKENGLKIAGDVLLTPLVTAVSGGPATPHEQRAVQIAMARAFRPWVRAERGYSVNTDVGG